MKKSFARSSCYNLQRFLCCGVGAEEPECEIPVVEETTWSDVQDAGIINGKVFLRIRETEGTHAGKSAVVLAPRYRSNTGVGGSDSKSDGLHMRQGQGVRT